MSKKIILILIGIFVVLTAITVGVVFNRRNNTESNSDKHAQKEIISSAYNIAK